MKPRPLYDADIEALLAALDAAAPPAALLKKYGVLEDLFWRTRDLQTTQRRAVIEEALRRLPVGRSGEQIQELLRGARNGGHRIDIGIVTMLESERRAALHLIGLRPDARHSFRTADGLRFWQGHLDVPNDEPASVVVTLAPEQGNVMAALTAAHLSTIYAPRLCALIGIAAGVHGEVALGDGLVAKAVFDYEDARLERGKPRRVDKRRVAKTLVRLRPRPNSLARELKADIVQLEHSDTNGLLQRWCLAACRSLKIDTDPNWAPTFRYGNTLSGEKLIANGRLREFKYKIDSNAIAADKEDSGFATSCDFQFPKLPWLVFRGISDFGDPKSKNRRSDRKRQPIAAVAAAGVASVVLPVVMAGLRESAETKKNEP